MVPVPATLWLRQSASLIGVSQPLVNNRRRIIRGTPQPFSFTLRFARVQENR